MAPLHLFGASHRHRGDVLSSWIQFHFYCDILEKVSQLQAGGAFMYLLPRRNARWLGRLRCQRYTEAAVALTCKPHYIFPWESKRLHERGLPVIYDAAGEQSDQKHQSAIARTRA